VLRGLVRDGLRVSKGVKIGDVDPRDDPSYCWLVSDKALAIGGGVLEAILSRAEVRKALLP
jgi:xanthine dehydrogenase accessory factor